MSAPFAQQYRESIYLKGLGQSFTFIERF